MVLENSDHFGDTLVVYGGVTDAGYRGELNKLYMISTSIDPFTQELEFTASGLGQENNGIARAYHTTTLLGNDLFVFGGHNSFGPLAQLQLFNLETRKWSTPRVKGAEPCPRYFAFAFVSSCVKSYLDLATAVW